MVDTRRTRLSGTLGGMILVLWWTPGGLVFYMNCVLFPLNFVSSIPVVVLPHIPRVLYYNLLLRRETRTPGVKLVLL